MEYILLTYFSDRPGMITAWHKFRPVAINATLLGLLILGLLAKTDVVRSIALGMATGIVLVNLGESINWLRSNEHKKLHGGNESIND
jgi:hypothetical protein